MSETSGYQEEIAVIGMACRFPGARNVEEFWQNLCSGKESLTFFSEEELLAGGEDPARLRSPSYVPAAPILEDIELFDASFFGYTPREAEMLDPQQRLFLECAWETLESAGYNPEQMEQRVGVFAGGSISNYLLYNLLADNRSLSNVGYLPILLGNDKDYLATRTAYKLNLNGPAVSVSTACSTSLVAIHLACQSLLSGESDLCLAGGVSLKVPHKVGYLYQEGGIFSPDGHCRAFDARAQGTMSGSGVGAVLLKRLADAIENRDCIHAIIKGSAINNDGSLKVGYTAPSVQGQSQVIAEAQAIAGVEPEDITYIETHGTGTPLGDPVEIAALTQVFRARTEKKGFCALGSVKTNIGHLDAGAGVAGFIKTVLALKHRQIPPSLHFSTPNPQIDLANSSFYVNTSLTPWRRDAVPLHAGVSSFGIGGTNVHIVLTEAPLPAVSGESRTWQLVLLSAKTGSALEHMSEHLTQYIRQHPDLSLADVAYTLQVGRRAFDYRRIVVCQSLDGAVSSLEAQDTRRTFTATRPSGDASIVFMFPGGGAQYTAMGQGLFQEEQTFRECIDRCSDLLKPHLGVDLRTVLYAEGAGAEAARDSLVRPSLALPALFATEYALAQLWMSWGIYPSAMIGHSLGEYVAACLAGVFSLEDALALVTLRGRLFERLPAGAMLSVALSAEALQPLLTPGLSLAAINTPSQCVVAGPKEIIDTFWQKMVDMGIECRKVHIDVAAHSEMVEPILSTFREFLHELDLHPPHLPFASNVTGAWITRQEATDPDYWVRHLRQTVYFVDGLRMIAEGGRKILLEVGPGRALTTFARQHFGVETDHHMLPSLRHPQDTEADLAFLLHTCGQLWCAGVPLDWYKFAAREKRYTIPLPTYPFERKRYWVDAKGGGTTDIRSLVQQKNAEISDWFYIPSWKRSACPLLSRSAPAAEKQQGWLLFVDNMRLGDGIARHLQRLHAVVITVSAGESFCKVSNRTYTLRPQHSADYEALMRELHTDGISLTYIVHLWTVFPVEQEQDDLAALDFSLGLSFYSLLFLMQVLSKQGIVQPLKLAIISNNLQEVIGGEVVRPERATVFGYSKIIPCEYEHVTCQTIDIVLPATEGELNTLAAQITSELCSLSSDQHIAYRGAYRWIQTIEPFPLHRAIEEKTRLRERGVYLITGGLGGVGSALATYLAQSARARLVLTGRTWLPAREEWEQYKAQDGDQGGIAARLHQIQTLEELGAEVLYIQADVADYEQMYNAFDLIHERFGTVHGVIHAAGVPSGNIIQMLMPEETASVLAPKVRGTLILSRLLKDDSLDFFVLCSALYAITGGFGQVDHCSGNTFLDSFACAYTASSHNWTVAVNWDAWAEVGQAAALARRLQQKDQPLASNDSGERKYRQGTEINLVGTILPQDGVEAFQRILTHAPAPQIIVSTRDVRTLQKYAGKLFTLFLQSEHGEENIPGEDTRYIQADSLAPRSELEKGIQHVWQTVLGLNWLDIRANFFEVGGDSVMILQMIKLIHDRYRVTIPMHLFFQKPTIAGLAEVVSQLQLGTIGQDRLAELISKVSQMSDEDVMEQLGKGHIDLN